MRDVPVHYDPVFGWVADVPRALPATMLQRLVAFVLRVNQQRVAGMPPGDTRELMRTRLDELRAKGIQQRVQGTQGIGLFEATRRTGKVINLGSE
jgi:hypothetical protein